MLLYIVRHGIAVDVGEQGVRTDRDRTLSATGRERTREAALGLARLNCRPQCVLTSPLVRAQETAAILARILTASPTFDIAEWLQPGVAATESRVYLESARSAAIMLVGHMPGVADMASLLLTGDERRLRLVFKKAAVCCLSFDDRPRVGSGCLKWLLQPGALRQLATAAENT